MVQVKKINIKSEYYFFDDMVNIEDFHSNLCNGCDAESMMAYELKKIAISNAKGIDYRCI